MTIAPAPPPRPHDTLPAAILRYGLVLVLLWFGAFKFTTAEASAIQPLLANSPLLSWLYIIADVQRASWLIGGIEIGIAALLAVRPFAPRWSAAGSWGAVMMFAITFSFLCTTPGLWVRVEGFVVPNEVGFILLKDAFLFGAAL